MSRRQCGQRLDQPVGPLVGGHDADTDHPQGAGRGGARRHRPPRRWRWAGGPGRRRPPPPGRRWPPWARTSRRVLSLTATTPSTEPRYARSQRRTSQRCGVLGCRQARLCTRLTIGTPAAPQPPVAQEHRRVDQLVLDDQVVAVEARAAAAAGWRPSRAGSPTRAGPPPRRCGRACAGPPPPAGRRGTRPRPGRARRRPGRPGASGSGPSGRRWCGWRRRRGSPRA